MKNISRTIFYALGIVVVGTVCYKIYSKYTQIPLYNRATPIKVSAVKVEKRLLSRKEVFAGILQAQESLTIASEIPGRIKKLNLTEDSYAKKGDLIIEIENDQQLAQLQLAQVQYDKALAGYNRAKALHDQGDISTVTLKDKESELKITKAKQEEALAAVNKMSIRAPFDGMVGLIKVSVGAYVQPNTEIAKFNKLNQLKVMFSVPVDRRPYIILDNAVQVQLDDSSLPIVAKITGKESNLQETSGLLDVAATFENPEYTYLPGQHAKITVITSKEESVLAVPEHALLFSDHDRVYVFIIRDGLVIEKTVEIGERRADDYYEITAGVSEGDMIVAEVSDSKNSRLIDGALVSVESVME